MAQLTLAQLLDLAIGTPEVGAVNFPTLHSLLQAILRHLGLLDLPAREVLGEQQLAQAQPGEEGAQGRGAGYRTLAPDDSLRETTSSPQVADVAADMDQMKKRTEANESSISKVEAVASPLGAPPIRQHLLQGLHHCRAALRPRSGSSLSSWWHVGLHCKKEMEIWGGRGRAEMLLWLFWILLSLPSASCGESDAVPDALGSASQRLSIQRSPTLSPSSSLPSPLLTYSQVLCPLLHQLRGSVGTLRAFSPTTQSLDLLKG